MKRTKFTDFKKKALENPEVKKEYDALLIGIEQN